MVEIANKKAFIGQPERKLEDMRAALLKQWEEEPATAELLERLARETSEMEVEQDYARMEKSES
jgi:hypothetical protein